MDHFALFEEDPRPWIDPERLREKFLMLSARLHPDKTAPEEKADAERQFAVLNEAYDQLLHTRTRLLHFLELQGVPNPAHVQSVPPAALEFFTEIADLTRRADELVKRKRGATSPMLQARLFETALELTERLQEVSLRLQERIQAIEGEVRQLHAVWVSTGNREVIDRLQSAAAALGFLERWRLQMQQLLSALAF